MAAMVFPELITCSICVGFPPFFYFSFLFEIPVSAEWKHSSANFGVIGNKKFPATAENIWVTLWTVIKQEVR